MNSVDVSFLIDFFNNIDIFLVIFVRMLGFFLIMPSLAGGNVPILSKIILAMFMTYILFLSGKVTEINYYNTISGYIFLLFTEFTVGFAIGFVVFLIFNAVYFAGQIMDYSVGLSMVNIFDPMTQTQVPIIGNLLYLVMTTMLIVTGGLNAFLALFFKSYDLIKIGLANINYNASLTQNMIQNFKKFLELGLQISLPILGIIIIVDVALGLLVRAVPQMNIFVVGVPLKLIIGITTLFLIVSPIVNLYHIIFDESYKAALNAMESLLK